MSLPNAYLTSFKNAGNILRAMQSAQAPPRFTQKFLEGLGYPSSNDRTMINMLKALGFIDDSGVPTKRYHRYLDQTQSAIVLAEGIREAYQDLFRINTSAHEMSTSDVKNKMRTLSEGQFTDRVLTQMAGTFSTLVKEADFTPGGQSAVTQPSPPGESQSVESIAMDLTPSENVPLPNPPYSGFNRLVYDIHIHLPESRDQAVYDALFRAMKEHLV